MRNGSERPNVSIIVCTRDRPQDVARCVQSAVAIEYPQFEVIVVDQGTTDEAERLVTQIESPHLRYYRQPVAGKSKALNAALGLATGEVIALTDDDCMVPPDWLKRGVEVLEREPKAGIVFGALKAAPVDWSQWFIPTFEPPEYARLEGTSAFLEVPKVGVGANMIIRRSLIDRLQRFDECLGPGSRFRSGDDTDFTYRALRAGSAVIQDPENAAVHWGARRYDDRAARRLFRNKYYGLAATFVKYARCDDEVAKRFLRRVLKREIRYVRDNTKQGKPLKGAGRILSLAGGVIAGMRQSLDRERMLYRTSGGRPAESATPATRSAKGRAQADRLQEP